MQMPIGDFYKIRAAQMQVGDCILYKYNDEMHEAWVNRVYLHPKSPYIKFSVDIPGQVINLYLRMDLNHFVYRKEESAVSKDKIAKALSCLGEMREKLEEFSQVSDLPGDHIQITDTIQVDKQVVLQSINQSLAAAYDRYSEIVRGRGLLK